MRGRIVKRSNSSWTIVYDLPRGVDGKRRQKFVAIRGTKRDAEKRLTEIQAQLDRGISIDTSKETVSQFIVRWLKDQVASTTRPRTLEYYEMVARVHIEPDRPAGGLRTTLPGSRLRDGDLE